MIIRYLLDNALIWFVAFVLSLIAINYKLLKKTWAEKKRGKELQNVVEGPKPHWLFGHLKMIQPNEKTLHLIIEQTQKFPKIGMTWFGPFIHYLQLIHPHVIRPVLNLNEPKDNMVYRFIRPWIGDGLLVSSGKKWHRNRHLLTRAFHFDILKEYQKVFNDCSGVMLNKWERRKAGEKMEISNDVTLMTLDVMLQCAISCKTQCQTAKSDHFYTAAVFKLASLAMMRLFNPLCHIDWIFSLTSGGKAFEKNCKIVHDFDEKVICERKITHLRLLDNATNSVSGGETDIEKISEILHKKGLYLDFLDILLLTRDEDGKGLSDREIRDEVDTFLFEGHDTTASGISWAFYCLASNPNLQEKCREEVKQVLGQREVIERSDLKKFNFLSMFIKEVLRLYPPVFAIARRAENPVKFSRGFGDDQFCLDDTVDSNSDHARTVKGPQNFGIPIIGVHRNMSVWERSGEFDPSRFGIDNKTTLKPYSYIPFSAGPRNCIGQNFALAEMKTVLAKSLLRFRIYVDDDCPKPEMFPMIVLKSKNGFNVKLEKINENKN